MSDPDTPADQPAPGMRRMVSQPTAHAVSPTVSAPVGAEVEGVRRAATALDGLADELEGWAEAARGLRLELGPRGGDETGRPPAPAPEQVDLVATAEAVPGLDARRRRVAAELVEWDDTGWDDAGWQDRPHRFAAQESERALHVLADVWSRALERRASDLHDVARSATDTAQGFDAADGGTTV